MVSRFILIVLAFSLDICPQEPWFRLVSPMENNLYSVHFNNTHTGWVAGDKGVISKTTDGGFNWDYQSPILKEEITTVTYFPFNNSIIFAGTKRGFLYRSTNGGGLWTDLKMQDIRTVRSIHFINSTTGFICGDSALLKKTTNGGLNWSNVQSGLSTLDLYGITSTNDGTLITAGRDGYILRSTNTGNTWSLVNSGVSANLYNVIYNPNDNKLWACGDNGVLLLSANNGLNWTIKSTGTQSALKAVAFVSAYLGWAVGDNGVILKTTDGGANWNRFSALAQSNFTSISISGTVIAIGGDAGFLLFSNDSGVNWGTDQTNELHKHNSISVSGLTGKIFAGGNYGHFFTRSLVSPQYDVWKKQPLFTDITYNMVKILNDTVGVAVGFIGSGTTKRGIIAKTTNGGKNWDTIPAPTTLPIYSIEMIDENKYWIAASNSTGDGINKLFYTTNGGSSWTERAFPIPAGVYIRKIRFTSQQKGFCSTTGDKILFTTNAGISWGYRTTPEPFSAVDFYDDWQIRAVAVKTAGVNPMHYYSSDAGTSWPNAFTLMTEYPVTAMKYFRSNYEILITEAGGVILFYPGLTNSLGSRTYRLYPYYSFYDLSFPDSLIGYLVGQNGIIYKTYTSGLPVELKSFTAECFDGKVLLKWSTATELNNHGFEVQRRVVNPQNQSANTWVTIAFIRGAGTSTVTHNYLYTDNPTSGFKYAYRIKQADYDGKFSFSEEAEVYLPADGKLEIEPNYPNPFSLFTTVNYHLPEAGDYRISVYNSIGEEIEIISDGLQQPGKHTLEWKAEKAGSGVYYLIVRGRGYKAGMKMMVVK